MRPCAAGTAACAACHRATISDIAKDLPKRYAMQLLVTCSGRYVQLTPTISRLCYVKAVPVAKLQQAHMYI